MRNLILLLALLVQQSAAAQNIVSNGDFETYSNCPSFWDHIYYCTGWKTATQTTPDYYNTCSMACLSLIILSVPRQQQAGMVMQAFTHSTKTPNGGNTCPAP